MEGVLQDTLKILAAARARSDSVVIGYSDGKDSRAVADLCSRTFDRVEAFYMELVPGLECVDEMLHAAEQRFSFDKPIHRYPHWMVPNLLKSGVFCNPWLSVDDLPNIKLRDIWDAVIADTGIPILMTGQKKTDGSWRKRTLANTKGYSDVVHPLAGSEAGKGWTKLDVLDFLVLRGIPVPDAAGSTTSGIDLTTPSLLWLHDKHPRDFQRVCEVFPFAETVVWRREWYGVGAKVA